MSYEANGEQPHTSQQPGMSHLTREDCSSRPPLSRLSNRSQNVLTTVFTTGSSGFTCLGRPAGAVANSDLGCFLIVLVIFHQMEVNLEEICHKQLMSSSPRCLPFDL
jgi:hypothetical protein